MCRNLRTGRADPAPAPAAPRRAPVAMVAVPLLLAAALGACGGGERTEPAGGSLVERARKQAAGPNVPTECAPGAEVAVGMAVTAYVQEVQPKPQRFLASIGTDSALPDAATRALQDRGPMYVFPASAEQQAKMRALLHEKGDYTTLLVVLREATRRDTIAVVRLDGHYVGGEEEGRTSGPRRYEAVCSAGRWRLGRSTPEQRA